MSEFSSVSFDEAISRSLSLDFELPSSIWLPLMDALGYVLSRDVLCQKNLPSYNNAAMDGYAFAYENRGKKLSISRCILAGQSVLPSLTHETCYKIMTGAKVPDDADTIVPFEECMVGDDGCVQLPFDIKQGNALRLKGEERAYGALLLKKGECIDSSSIALLASQGISHVDVYRKLRVAVLSTGDELKKPWESASEDAIYDVNAFALMALLKEQGFETHYGGVVPDNEAAAIAYFKAMQSYDVILSSGGVSMGEADFVEKALCANGFVASFHGIHIKPGKPTMFGMMGSTLVASMPGNPLAAYINAFLFLIPVLKKRSGQSHVYFGTTMVTLQKPLKLKAGRVNIVLGHIEQNTFCVFGENRYGSGMITPLVQSNALLITDEKTEFINEGECINVLLIRSRFCETIEHLKN